MSFQEYTESSRLRLQFESLTAPQKAGIVALIILCIAASIFFVGGFSSGGIQVEKAEAQNQAQESQEAYKQPVQLIYVHVAGCVQTPGMYELKTGARLAEAIQAAGGFTEEAAAESVNLAREIKDGEQIIVANKNGLGAQDARSQASTGLSNDATGKVNINTADETKLQTISGIGPSKAKKIIDYRETNGPFKSITDLSKVSGIGEKTLESIKDQICV